MNLGGAIALAAVGGGAGGVPPSFIVEVPIFSSPASASSTSPSSGDEVICLFRGLSSLRSPGELARFPTMASGKDNKGPTLHNRRRCVTMNIHHRLPLEIVVECYRSLFPPSYFDCRVTANKPPWKDIEGLTLATKESRELILRFWFHALHITSLGDWEDILRDWRRIFHWTRYVIFPP